MTAKVAKSFLAFRKDVMEFDKISEQGFSLARDL
jgi:hypothetical protein